MIELLTITDAKVFSVAVYPTLAKAELKIAAFTLTNNVEVEVGNEAYSTAMMTVLASVELIH